MPKYIHVGLNEEEYRLLKEAKKNRSWHDFLLTFGRQDPRFRLQLDISSNMEALKERTSGALRNGFMVQTIELMKAILVNLTWRKENTKKIVNKVNRDLNKIMNYLTEEEKR